MDEQSACKLLSFDLLFIVCMCVFVFCVSEHSCDVDSTPEGELCLPLLSPADAPPYLHPQVNSLPASLSQNHIEHLQLLMVHQFGFHSPEFLMFLVAEKH